MDDCRHVIEKYANSLPFDCPFSFRKNSTIGVGGEAKIAFYPRTIEEMTSLLGALDRDGVSYAVLGALSNVLPKDGKSDQVIISTKKLSSVIFGEEIFALAGTSTPCFLKECKAYGFTGGEFLTGIPCTLGGAIYMNAGVQGAYMDSIVSDVLVYKDGKTSIYSKADCDFSYKHSVFMHEKSVIVGATFVLKKASDTIVEERIAYYKGRRKARPKGRSMGCVFKNPQGKIAGKLIEECALKGRRIGGAYVSEKHANFILSDGDKAQDVKQLIQEIKSVVFTRTGVLLEEEIRYLD